MSSWLFVSYTCNKVTNTTDLKSSSQHWNFVWISLIKYRAQKNKNVIYRPCSVRIGRYLPSVMTSGKYLPIRTSRPVNNIYVTPALRAIRWLPVEEHLKYREALMAYKCMNGLAPPYLSELFIKRNEIHDLNTRNKKALHIPQYKTVSGTFYYRAVKLWNDLHEDLKKLPWKRLKTELKQMMLNNN